MNPAFLAIWNAFAKSCAPRSKGCCALESPPRTADPHRPECPEWTMRKSSCVFSTRAKMQRSTWINYSKRGVLEVVPTSSAVRTGFWSHDDGEYELQEPCFGAFKGESGICLLKTAIGSSKMR